ncbi:MAG: YegS/Rv2252/BmrU family lipid kinase [Eubacterium sp.]|nr:YegS/Rv2252/BmrU family lipid kinase [Eubacterium sp.]
MREKKLLFIYNPCAGKGTMKSKLSDVIETFMHAEYEVTIYATQREREATELVMELGKNFHRIICSGGDGTLHEVTQGLMNMPPEERPVCGYIPTGTVNDFARGLNLPTRIRNAAKIAVTDKIKPMDIGLMNGEVFTYVAAFGAFTSVSYETPQTFKNLLGRAAYLLEGMGQVANIKSYPMTIQTGEERITDEFLFGMVSNAKSVGGFSFFKKGQVSLNDGKFEGIFIRKPKNPQELQAVINSFVTLKPNEQIIGVHSDSFIITSEQEVAYTLDGENGGSHKRVEIACCYRPIEYVCG